MSALGAYVSIPRDTGPVCLVLRKSPLLLTLELCRWCPPALV